MDGQMTARLYVCVFVCLNVFTHACMVAVVYVCIENNHKIVFMFYKNNLHRIFKVILTWTGAKRYIID